MNERTRNNGVCGGGGWILSQNSGVSFFFSIRLLAGDAKRAASIRLTRPTRSDALLLMRMSHQICDARRPLACLSSRAGGGFVKSCPSFAATSDRTAQQLVLISACLKRGTCVAEAATSRR